MASILAGNGYASSGLAHKQLGEPLCTTSDANKVIFKVEQTFAPRLCISVFDRFGYAFDWFGHSNALSSALIYDQNGNDHK